VSSGVLPDLRWSAMTASEQAWDSVLRDGVLSERGMVSFADSLTKEDTDALRAYVVKQAWDAYNIANAEVADDGVAQLSP